MFDGKSPHLAVPESDLHLVRKACGDQALWYMVLAGFKAAQAVQLVYTRVHIWVLQTAGYGHTK